MSHSNSSNVAFLQAALKNLEERYKKLQNRNDSLQLENERLVASRTELVNEVERLQDQQIRLRERNLRLTQEFHSKQQECSLLAEKLTMFARGRVGNYRGGDSSKSDSNDLKEDTEDSRDSLVTVELYGGDESSSRPKVLDVASRTYSEPNLSVIQRELDLVRKGLWSPALENPKLATAVEELSSKTLIPNQDHHDDEFEEQFSRMMDMEQADLPHLANETDQVSFADDADPVDNVKIVTQASVMICNKVKSQNLRLHRIHQILKMAAGKILSNHISNHQN